MKHSDSYKDCSCGGDCWLHNLDNIEKYGPCWGECHAVDEYASTDLDGNLDYEWVHACEGHRECYEELFCKPDLTKYKEEIKNG